jgi:two-component system cell cycle sensor histidine kinase/response regulator CckA
MISIVARETVLVVYDKPSVLAEISSILKNAKFIVLSASSPEEALQISLDFAGTIDLLLTEVMMPGMSGPDLARKLIAQRTKLRIMMITGYANGELLILTYGWHLAKKPFVAEVLCEKVRDLLRSPDRSQGTYGFDTRDVARTDREEVNPRLTLLYNNRRRFS